MQKPTLIIDNGAHSIKANLVGSTDGPRSVSSKSKPASVPSPILVGSHTIN